VFDFSSWYSNSKGERNCSPYFPTEPGARCLPPERSVVRNVLTICADIIALRPTMLRLLLALCIALPSYGVIAAVSGANATASAAAGGTATTSAIDTTGSTLMVMVVANYGVDSSTATIVDSKSNTWTALTNYVNGNSNVAIFYAQNPTVGSGHTFSCTGGYCTIFVSGWSGTATTSVFDVQNGASTSGASLQTGSVTPSQADSLIISGFGDNDNTALSIDSGFTKINQQRNNSSSTGADAYLIQTTASAVNPTWTASGTVARAAAIAVFKPAGSGAPAMRRRQPISF
jgi:hypothetical protein